MQQARKFSRHVCRRDVRATYKKHLQALFQNTFSNERSLPIQLQIFICIIVCVVCLYVCIMYGFIRLRTICGFHKSHPLDKTVV
jgi:hypothetical protein